MSPGNENGSGRYDAVIVGGGPAGLSAALVLGRCRRRVLVVDSGRYRNAASKGVHGFLTRDGVPPAELLALARAQLEPYPVEFRRDRVVSACRVDEGFEVRLEDGDVALAAKLILATGVVDQPPPIEGIESFYGVSIHHCPYCDGWESRDEPIAVYGRGRAGCELSLSLKTWSDDVLLVTDGPSRLRASDFARLAAHAIRTVTRRILRFEGEGDQLERIVFRDGSAVARRRLFFTTGQTQHSQLPEALGCRHTVSGAVLTNRLEETTVPGVFVVGDASRDPQLVVIAAAEGAKAAFAVNQALQRRDRLAVESGLRDGGVTHATGASGAAERSALRLTRS